MLAESQWYHKHMQFHLISFICLCDFIEPNEPASLGIAGVYDVVFTQMTLHCVITETHFSMKLYLQLCPLRPALTSVTPSYQIRTCERLFLWQTPNRCPKVFPYINRAHCNINPQIID